MDSKPINLSEIKTYLTNQGLDISQDSAEEFINSCFADSDTKNEQGETVDGGDGFLTGIEKSMFLKNCYSKLNSLKEELATKIENLLWGVSDYFSEHIKNEKGEDIHRYYELLDGNPCIKEFSDAENRSIQYDDDGNYLGEYYSDNKNNINKWYDSNHRLIMERDKNFKTTKYYEDGTVRSIQDDKNTVVYYHSGELSTKVYNDESGNKVSERYHKDGTLGMKEVYNHGVLIERTIYKNNEIFLDVKYDINGSITDVIKNLPEGEIDFDEELLNGEFDADFTQGQTGVCYLASGVKGLLQTEKGRELLKKTLKYDKENGIGTVSFSGLNREYTFTKADVKNAMTRLGTGDPDFTLLCLGYEKYREENGQRVDSGHSDELIFAVSGKHTLKNYDVKRNEREPIDDNMMKDLTTVMQSGNGFACAGCYQELPPEAETKDIHLGHEYYLKNIDNGMVLVSDALVKKDVLITKEEFQQWFGILEFAEL